jgi:hypothetical protein
MLEFALVTAGQVFADSGSSDDGGNFGLVLLASGFVFYALIYFRYRNVDKRHKHESETEATMHNLREDDRKVKSLKGLSNSRMAGENGDEVRGARRRFF